MNVVFLTHSRHPYGANRSLVSLIVGLRKRFGVNASLIAPAECWPAQVLREAGHRVAAVPLPSWFQSDDYERPRSLSRNHNDCPPELIAQLASWGADLVYSNSAMIHLGAQAAERLSIPHVWHLREFGDLDYGRRPVWGWPVVQATVLQSVATVSVSRAVRRHFFEAGGRATDRVVDNGVAWASQFDALREQRGAFLRQRPSDSPFTFALVGRIVEGKGHRIAIEALARLRSRHAKLILAGGGDCGQLHEAACELGVADRVDVRGYVPDASTVFLESDAALMCSRHEAFGRVTAEAMASGLPVIGRDAGGTPELIRHGRDGLLFTGGPDDLADRMDCLIANPGRSREMGDAARCTAQKRFSIERYTDTLWAVIQSAAGRPACTTESVI